MSKLRHRPSYVIDNQVHEGPRDRRIFPRYPAVRDDCWLGWWREAEARIVSGRLLDISQKGVSVVADEAPALGQPVWICPAASPSFGWVEGAVVGLGRHGRPRIIGRRPYRIGISLRDSFSWDVLKGVLYKTPDGGEPLVALPPLPAFGDQTS